MTKEDDEKVDFSIAASKATIRKNKSYLLRGAELERRAKDAGIGITLDDDFDAEKFYSVEMPNGSKTRQLYLFGEDRLQAFIDVEFEKFVFLGNYNAVACYEEGYVEAVLGSLGPSSLDQFRRVILGRGPMGKEDEDEIAHIVVSEGPITIRIGSPTRELAPLLRSRAGSLNRISIRIEGLSISTHEQATHALERLSNSLFFQLDANYGVAPTLEKVRPRAVGRGSRGSAEPSPPQFPKFEYDREPITLFWYGRSAVGMPLLQYLAFYQVIEFYFPTYSQREAGRRLRNMLKEPTFRADRDGDIARILSSIRFFKSGSYGSEREQLRAVLKECLEDGELRSFAAATKQRKTFLSSKQRGITSYKLSIDSATADVRNEAADLMYDIRCKIVHSKEEGGDDVVLLPFSDKADLMFHYIDLAQFVAQRVLVASSSPLSIG